MCTDCNPVDEAEAYIARYGWAITTVEQEDHDWPAFAYTSGLTGMGCPEVICYGLPVDEAAHILNDVSSRMVRGVQFEHGAVLLDVLPDGYPVRLIEVIDKTDMGVTCALYPEFTAWQVVWPDSHGRFPWDCGYSTCPHHQPLTGVGWV